MRRKTPFSFARSSEGLPNSATLPSARTTILSAASTVRIRWAMTRTVFPCSRRERADMFADPKPARLGRREIIPHTRKDISAAAAGGLRSVRCGADSAGLITRWKSEAGSYTTGFAASSAAISSKARLSTITLNARAGHAQSMVARTICGAVASRRTGRTAAKWKRYPQTTKKIAAGMFLRGLSMVWCPFTRSFTSKKPLLSSR